MLDVSHRPMDEIEQQVRVWLAHRPGLFERPNEHECQQAMLADFTRGYPDSGLTAELFFTYIKVAGFETRATPTGGFILDWSR